MVETLYKVKSTLYILMSQYAINGNRNVLSYDPTTSENSCIFTAGPFKFKICRRQIGEKFENPGVNLVFAEESNQLQRTNPQGKKLLMSVHVVASHDQSGKTSTVVSERYVDQAKQFVDAALFGGNCRLVEYNPLVNPPILSDGGKSVYWRVLDTGDGDWQNNTDFSRNNRFHHTKNLTVFYDADLIS